MQLGQGEVRWRRRTLADFISSLPTRTRTSLIHYDTRGDNTDSITGWMEGRIDDIISQMFLNQHLHKQSPAHVHVLDKGIEGGGGRGHVHVLNKGIEGGGERGHVHVLDKGIEGGGGRGHEGRGQEFTHCIHCTIYHSSTPKMLKDTYSYLHVPIKRKPVTRNSLRVFIIDPNLDQSLTSHLMVRPA